MFPDQWCDCWEGMLCCLGAGGQEPAGGTGSLEACLGWCVSITLISGNSGVRWMWCRSGFALNCLSSPSPVLSGWCPAQWSSPGTFSYLCPFLLGHTGLSCCCSSITFLQCTLVPKHFSLLILPRISSLTATLHMHSRKKKKGKRPQRGQGPFKKIQKPSMRRTTKTQRRRLTGKMGRDQD